MASFIDDLRAGFFRRHGIIAWLIAINVGVFLVFALANTVTVLVAGQVWDDVIYNWLGLRAHLPTLAGRPWGLVTYAFVHELSDILHLLFNMLYLYWIGAMILRDFMPDRRILGLYAMGGIAGGLLFVLAYNLLPVFRMALPDAKLFGASAAVLAVVVGTATLVPNYQIGLLFFGLVRLKWLALVMVLLDIIQIRNNPGGMIAHLGGALIGVLYVSSYSRGNDWLRVFDGIGEAFGPRARSAKHVRVSVRQASAGRAASNSARVDSDPNTPSQAEVDRILDKIKAVGYDRLTVAEKQTLLNASKN